MRYWFHVLAIALGVMLAIWFCSDRQTPECHEDRQGNFVNYLE